MRSPNVLATVVGDARVRSGMKPVDEPICQNASKASGPTARIHGPASEGRRRLAARPVTSTRSLASGAGTGTTGTVGTATGGGASSTSLPPTAYAELSTGPLYTPVGV